MIKWNGHDIIQCNAPGLLRDYTALRVDIPVMKEIDESDSEDEQKEPSMLQIVEEGFP